jgi:hypothetical protein
MTAFFLSFIMLIGALAVIGLIWVLLGKPEPICPECDQPESLCECGGRGPGGRVRAT